MAAISWIAYKKGPNAYEQEVFETLCKNSEAKDYYVDVYADGPRSVAVTICPGEIFHHFKYLHDETPMIEHLLPEWIAGELQEAVLESTRSVDETIRELLKRGFLMSTEFSNLCRD